MQEVGRLRGWKSQRQFQLGMSLSLGFYIAWNCWAQPDYKCLLGDKSWEIRSSLLMFEKIQDSLSPLLASVTPSPSSAPCAKDTLHWVAPGGNSKGKYHTPNPAACAGISCLFLTGLWADFLNTGSSNFSSIAILPNWFSCFPECCFVSTISVSEPPFSCSWPPDSPIAWALITLLPATVRSWS